MEPCPKKEKTLLMKKGCHPLLAMRLQLQSGGLGAHQTLRIPASSVKPTVHKLTDRSFVYVAANVLTQKQVQRKELLVRETCIEKACSLFTRDGVTARRPDIRNIDTTYYKGSRDIITTVVNGKKKKDVTYTAVFLFGDVRTFIFTPCDNGARLHDGYLRATLRPYPSSTCSLVIFGSDVTCQLLTENLMNAKDFTTIQNHYNGSSSDRALVVPLSWDQERDCCSPELFPSPGPSPDHLVGEQEVDYLALSQSTSSTTQ
jgi:hypothetical protein